MADPQLLRCPRCAEPLKRQEEIPYGDGQMFLELYICTRDGCGQQFAGWWSLQGALSSEQQSWVEQQVMRRGAFFPADITGGRGPGRFGR